ncbi:MAG: hypothetical protein JXA66_03805 [Oligoflexia bacterium]|nr:hypothetical protein [Oligoflexia bacterium]
MQFLAKVYLKHGTYTGQLTSFKKAHEEANNILKNKPTQSQVYAIVGMELRQDRVTKKVKEDWYFYRSYVARAENDYAADL